MGAACGVDDAGALSGVEELAGAALAGVVLAGAALEPVFEPAFALEPEFEASCSRSFFSKLTSTLPPVMRLDFVPSCVVGSGAFPMPTT